MSVAFEACRFDGNFVDADGELLQDVIPGGAGDGFIRNRGGGVSGGDVGLIDAGAAGLGYAAGDGAERGLGQERGVNQKEKEIAHEPAISLSEPQMDTDQVTSGCSALVAGEASVGWRFDIARGRLPRVSCCRLRSFCFVYGH